jgi:hypothetical protein
MISQRTLAKSNPRKKTGNGEGRFLSPQQWRRRSSVSNSDGQTTYEGELSPEQRLEPPNTRLINAGIVTINDMETLRACVAYENANQQRIPILRQLKDRASEIRAEDE